MKPETFALLTTILALILLAIDITILLIAARLEKKERRITLLSKGLTDTSDIKKRITRLYRTGYALAIAVTIGGFLTFFLSKW